MLDLRNVHKKYIMGEHTVYALRGVTLKVEQGDYVAIMGPSGSGKSTLMHVMGLLDVPSEGSYLVDGNEIAGLDENALSVLRRKVIGFIFQQFNLLPRMSALENVSLPYLYSEGKFNLPKAQELLAKVNLENRQKHRPNELSGGQQQRVAIARALANNPRILLADEPTGNLDSVSEREVMTLLKSLNDAGITVIIVTHEEEIGKQAKRLIRMRDGVIQSDERLTPLRPITEAQQEKIQNQNSKTANAASATSSLWQHFAQGVKTLATNKIRTGLSMLGILIGVGAVVAMLALGRGAQKAIEEQLSSLGSNLLVLRSGAMRGMGGVFMDAGAVTRLSLDDAQLIKDQIPYIKEAGGNVNGRGQVTYLNKNWSTSIIGVAASYAKAHALEPTMGRFFTEEENRMRARVAVIGMTLVRELFANQNPIGEYIKINKVAFQVIGILPEKGGNSFQDQDDRIAIPVVTAMYRLLGKTYVDYIDIEVSDATKTDFVQAKVLELMLSRHKVALSQQQDAFNVRNMAEIQAALTASTQIMTLLLSVIAAISLIVGGIGIMNIMLVSVTERTREIGLRKAVGAKRGDILSQFLIESIVISLVGGTLGILLAWISTLLLSAIAGWATSITITSIVLAVGFSTTIGVIFGIYPARKASLLPPIDALRYE